VLIQLFPLVLLSMLDDTANLTVAAAAAAAATAPDLSLLPVYSHNTEAWKSPVECTVGILFRLLS